MEGGEKKEGRRKGGKEEESRKGRREEKEGMIGGMTL